ncbi:hypothetical protein ACTGJ9_001100 [Bradyrhizobium sp. RDM12]
MSTFEWYKHQIFRLVKSLILLKFGEVMSSPALGTKATLFPRWSTILYARVRSMTDAAGARGFLLLTACYPFKSNRASARVDQVETDVPTSKISAFGCERHLEGPARGRVWNQGI